MHANIQRIVGNWAGDKCGEEKWNKMMSCTGKDGNDWVKRMMKMNLEVDEQNKKKELS